MRHRESVDVSLKNYHYKIFLRLLDMCHKKPIRFRVERDNWGNMSYSKLIVEFTFKSKTRTDLVDAVLNGRIKV
jgi:hypothetical protein